MARAERGFASALQHEFEPADGGIEAAGDAVGHFLQRRRIGIHFAVTLVDDLPRSEYKARRWQDERVR